jgi:hypothetical protein
VSVAARAGSTTAQGQPFGYGLAVYRGDSAQWQFVLWADPDRTVPVDLTGVVVAAQMRDKPDGLQVIHLTCTITLPNTINVVLAAASSAGAVSGSWDLQLTTTAGTVTTIVAGSVIVTRDITVP